MNAGGRRLSKIFFEQNDPRKPGSSRLYDISLAIRKNEFVSLLGPSGCGKTTLIRYRRVACGGPRRLLVNQQCVTAPDATAAWCFKQFGLLPWRTV